MFLYVSCTLGDRLSLCLTAWQPRDRGSLLFSCSWQWRRILPVLLVLCEEVELLLADIDELVKLFFSLLCPQKLLLPFVNLVDLFRV